MDLSVLGRNGTLVVTCKAGNRWETILANPFAGN